MSRRLIFIVGGARSGKSRYAEESARQAGDHVLFVATAQAHDKEMQRRIAIHRSARSPAWQTIEAPTGVGAAVRSALGSGGDAVLIDCITLLVSNVMLQGLSPQELSDVNVRVDEAAAHERLDAEIEALLDAFHASAVPWIVVSNEVGSGLVPAYPLGRLYRDLLGWANQRLAAQADEVYLMVAGLPLRIK